MFMKTLKMLLNVEKRLDTSNYEFDAPLPKGKNKKKDWSNER